MRHSELREDVVAVFRKDQVEQEMRILENPLRRNSVQALAACRNVDEAPVLVSDPVVHLIDHPQREVVGRKR